MWVFTVRNSELERSPRSMINMLVLVTIVAVDVSFVVLMLFWWCSTRALTALASQLSVCLSVCVCPTSGVSTSVSLPCVPVVNVDTPDLSRRVHWHSVLVVVSCVAFELKHIRSLKNNHETKTTTEGRVTSRRAVMWMVDFASIMSHRHLTIWPAGRLGWRGCGCDLDLAARAGRLVGRHVRQ